MTDVSSDQVHDNELRFDDWDDSHDWPQDPWWLDRW